MRIGIIVEITIIAGLMAIAGIAGENSGYYKGAAAICGDQDILTNASGIYCGNIDDYKIKPSGKYEIQFNASYEPR
jgi:hypothetical protein